MRYKNIKTGAIVDSPFIVEGTDWEVIPGENLETKDLSHPELLQLINEKDQKIKELLVKIEELEGTVNTTEDIEYVEEEIDLEKMTNDELETFADKNKITLTAKDKKNKETRIAAIVAAFEQAV